MRKTAFCSSLACDFSTSFHADGSHYFETCGQCPMCGGVTVYYDGKPTAPEFGLKMETVKVKRQLVLFVILLLIAVSSIGGLTFIVWLIFKH
jgi:hypothetical protein